MAPEPPVIMTVRPSRRKDLKTLSSTCGLGALMDFRHVPFVPLVAILGAVELLNYRTDYVSKRNKNVDECRFAKCLKNKLLI
jgi:hypothetical protein